MKLKKMLNRFSVLTNLKWKKLKKKNRELKKKISAENDKDKRKKLKDRLKVVTKQRSKGLALLKGLRDKPKPS